MDIRTIIGSLIFGIVGTICLPIVQDVITDANFTGTVGTIMNNVPVFYALTILLGVVAGIYLGVRH